MRGYTLIETMVAVALAGVLAGLGAWGGSRLLAGWRADSLARRLAMDVRMAQALAARRNRAVTLQVRLAPADGCAGPSYRIAMQDGSAVHETVCIPADHPGVELGVAGAAEVGCGFALALPPGGCSFCGAAGGALTILPTGELVAAGAAPYEALAIAPREDLETGRHAGARLVAFAMGTARVHQLQRAPDGAWVCP